MSLQKNPASLVYPWKTENGRVSIALGLKMMKVGAGRRNGFGGKRDQDESIRTCAARELFEESGLLAESALLEKAALIHFFVDGKTDPMFVVHIFFAKEFRGALKEKEPEKMRDLRWYDEDSVPYADMQAGDSFFLPRLLKGEKIEGSIWFEDETTKKVVRHNLRPVEAVSEDS